MDFGAHEFWLYSHAISVGSEAYGPGNDTGGQEVILGGALAAVLEDS